MGEPRPDIFISVWPTRQVCCVSDTWERATYTSLEERKAITRKWSKINASTNTLLASLKHLPCTFFHVWECNFHTSCSAVTSSCCCTRIWLLPLWCTLFQSIVCRGFARHLIPCIADHRPDGSVTSRGSWKATQQALSWCTACPSDSCLVEQWIRNDPVRQQFPEGFLCLSSCWKCLILYKPFNPIPRVLHVIPWSLLGNGTLALPLSICLCRSCFLVLFLGGRALSAASVKGVLLSSFSFLQIQVSKHLT